MHLAPIARRALIGLSVVISCFAVLPKTFAWSLFPSRSSESQPAADAAAQSAPSVNATMPRRGPLYHGQELRLPTMPFGRSKSAATPPANRSYVGSSRANAYLDSQAVARSGAPQAPAVPQQRMSQLPPGTQARPHQALNASRGSENGTSARSAGYPANPSLSAAAQAMPRSAGQPPHYVGNRPQQPAMNTAAPTMPDRAVRTAAHVEGTPREPMPARGAVNANAPVAAAPESPADRLIGQAHAWSSSAQTEADFTRIIETCRQARAAQPDSESGRYASDLASWAFNRRGQLKAEAGRHQEALVDFDDAIRADPERWLAIHNRGLLLAQSGELERAFDDFARTIELKPDFAKAYSNRAALLMVAGDYTAALIDYKRAIELSPSLAVAQRGCGRAYHVLGRLDEAVRCYNDAVRLTPDDAYAATSRADVLTDLGRYAEAAAEYNRSIHLDPSSGQAHSSSAWLLATCPDASVRNPALAVERAKEAIELTGAKDAVAFDTHAAALAAAGDFTAAMQSVEKAVELAPAEERAIYEQRLLMYQHGKPYRIAPVGEVMQASYDTASAVQEGGRWE